MLEFFTWLNDIVWGVPTLILLMGVGLILTFRLRFVQFRQFGTAFKEIFTKKSGNGDVSSYAALTVMLSATIGTGNIVGIAGAIMIGGPGALFWMVIAAFIGMATAYAEATLAVKFRVKDKDGNMLGGPFEYIERGMGKKWKWLAVVFAVFTMLASCFGIGSMIQMQSMIGAVNNLVGPIQMVSIFGFEVALTTIITSVVVTFLASIVILGGIKAIARVTTKLLPIMAIFYIGCALLVLAFNYQHIPNAFIEIFRGAFNMKAVAGGAAGTVMMLAIQKGLSRGFFSNEAGLGSTPITAAAAKCDYPAQQGLINMTAVFIDTIIICTLTGLVVVITGTHNLNLTGVAVTSRAFEIGLGEFGFFGTWAVNLGIIFFVFSTIIGWCYYGERSAAYLFGIKGAKCYRWAHITTVFIGAYLELTLVWSIADSLNGLMAIPNLIAVLALSSIVVAENKRFIPGKKLYNGKEA